MSVKHLQIFKPGKHTAADGRVLEFSAAQLEACAKAYDPALHEAPIVVGHPKSDLPAYGWAGKLAFDGKVLTVEPHQVNPDFAELVNGGAFKKVSASFYLPDAPENPKPGALYLRHIGFLGAQAPAIKGLKSASFSASGEGVVEFTDWNAMSVAGLFRRVKNWIIDSAGQEKADAVIPEYELESLQIAAASKTPEPSPTYSEGEDDVTKEELAAREQKLKDDQAALDKQRTEFAERDKTLKAEQAAAARAAALATHRTFIDGLVKEGKVLPAQVAGLVAFMAALPSEGVVEFGEGDKAVKKPSVAWLQEYLKAQPKVVEFKEHGNRGAEPIDTSNPVKAANEIARRAAEFQESESKAGRAVSIDMAVQHVISQGEPA